MRRIFVAAIIAIFFAGCTTTGTDQKPLSNLTDKQADWFKKTSQNWRFK